MKIKRRNSIPSKYLLLLVSLFCGLLLLIEVLAGGRGVFRFVGNYTLLPMQRGINFVGGFVSDFSGNFQTLKEMKEENQRLQAKVDELTIDNTYLRQEQYELERLRALYQLDADYSDYKKIGAKVIANNGSNWFSDFTINKGSRDGVQVNSNVLSGSGLVGIVTEVAPNHARVRALIDDASNISGMTLSTSDLCMVKGDLKLMSDGRIRFEKLPNNENKIEVGEQVVTSHVSSRFLQGLFIGYISEIHVDANNLTRSGYITPAVDFSHLQEVLVIPQTKEDLIQGER